MAIMDYIPQWGQSLGTQDVSGVPADDATAQLLLKRRLAQADALRQQEMPQAQMVSGRYVAPSWTQYLANAYGKMQAGADERAAMKQYGDYLSQQRKTKQEAMSALAKALQPKAITEEGSYDIQVPSGKTPTPTDNLGGMQPYESGMKNVSVPMTTTTGYKQPDSTDIYNAISAYANATNQPDMAEKMLFSQAGKALEPKQYDWKEAGGVLYQLDKNGNPTKVQLGTPKKEKPQFETFHEGVNKVTYQIMPDGSRVKIATGAAFAPEKPEPDPYHLNTPKIIPPKNANGWALHTDKNGNMAYVSPDGKSFEEVK